MYSIFVTTGKYRVVPCDLVAPGAYSDPAAAEMIYTNVPTVGDACGLAASHADRIRRRHYMIDVTTPSPEGQK